MNETEAFEAWKREQFEKGIPRLVPSEAWQAALEWRDGQVGEPVAYISQDELNMLLSGKAGNHIHVGLDTREAWPQGSDESAPYDWLVALYQHPPTAQINQQLVAESLEAVETVLSDAYHRHFAECCGKGQGDCCGDFIEQWAPEDRKILDALSPVQRKLQAALTAAKS